MRRFILVGLTLIYIFYIPGLSQSEENCRYFDKAGINSDKVRLAILYPTSYPLDSLHKLIDIGFLNIENLEVIGIYHEKESTDYQRAIDMVREKNLDWVKFHKVTGTIDRTVLFQKNELTAEFEQIFAKSDGIIFFGGADIPPRIYGKDTSLLTAVRTPFRHYLELSFIFHLLGGSQDKNFIPLLRSAPDFLVLGICLGEQSLNVGTGGTMIQDIWSDVYSVKTWEDAVAMPQIHWHTNANARLFPEEGLFSYWLHPIKLAPQGFFVRELGFKPEDTPHILSAHHQAVEKLGYGLRVIATSMDGKIIEALEHKKFPNVLGIQFHPEFPIIYEVENTFRTSPEETEETNIMTILENNPPSFKFHKKIWQWVSERLQESHKKHK